MKTGLAVLVLIVTVAGLIYFVAMAPNVGRSDAQPPPAAPPPTETTEGKGPPATTPPEAAPPAQPAPVPPVTTTEEPAPAVAPPQPPANEVPLPDGEGTEPALKKITPEKTSEPPPDVVKSPDNAKPPQPPVVVKRPLTPYEEAQKLIKDGEPVKGRQALTKLILAAHEGPEREKIRAALNDLNDKLFFSGEPASDFTAYTVEDSDVLWIIQRKTKRPLEIIRLINHLSNDIVRPGQTLHIPSGKFTAIVDRDQMRLTVLMDGQYIKEYPVGIGKGELTPAGTFEIVRKVVNPSWTDPQGKFYKFGDPENQLGTRWLAFKDVGKRTGLGIHGTNDETSIGTKCSNGCVRLHNKDVEEVYGMLLIGDQVTIK